MMPIGTILQDLETHADLACVCGSIRYRPAECEGIHWMICARCGRWFKPEELERVKHGP